MTPTDPDLPRAHDHEERCFRPLGCAVLAVSDTRDLQSDLSGAFLAEKLREAGHELRDRIVVRDEVEAIREQVLAWASREEIHAILITGGTGLFARDVTPEALEPLFEKHMPGFGELFRHLSFREIGTATIESRATAGVIQRTLVFAMPGSRGACRLAIEEIILPQLDARTRPCSVGGMIERL